MRLNEKVMLVTGGASGIGQASVLRCAREGAELVVVDINEAELRETERMLGELGEDALFIQADVTMEPHWQRVVNQVEERYGRLDILFSNAGNNLVRLITETTVEEWDAIFNLNLRGVFLGSKYVIPLMLKGGGGNIINMASTFGIIGFSKMPAYCASKGGVIALTRQLALDYAQHNIRVNCICPGPTLTPRIKGYIEKDKTVEERNLATVPMGRWAQPEEIAAVVAFMASDDTSYMTGAAIVVDGGQTIH
ncbi:SDR family NAD(P)-dependent oxidoreductase [Chloroflexota bacterium]